MSTPFHDPSGSPGQQPGFWQQPGPGAPTSPVPDEQSLNPSWIGRVDPDSYTQPGATVPGAPPLPQLPLPQQSPVQDQWPQQGGWQQDQAWNPNPGWQQQGYWQAGPQGFQHATPQNAPSGQGWQQPFPHQPAPQYQQAAAYPFQDPRLLAGARVHRNINPATLTLMIIGGVLAFLSLVLVLPLLLSNVGGQGFLGGFFASLIPLAIVLTAVYFMDRWEPEPRKLLLFALLWGATVAVATTVIIQPFFLTLAPEGSTKDDLQTFLATVEAPIVEEFSKSLGLLLLALLARKYFDGPVDGLVYAFTIAAGFAFTENILYFGRIYVEEEGAGQTFWTIVFLRGILSPFAHALFTGTTGLLMGFAARRWSRGLTVAAFFVGLLPAMFLHHQWNSMGEDFLWLYIVIQMPLFLLAVVGFILLRVAEAKLTRARLSEYAAAGWLTWAEVGLFATGSGRRAAKHWASQWGRQKPMRDLIRTATALAYTRQRILSGRDLVRLQQDEHRLLDRLGQLRGVVAG
ncbi:PrsW family glutamic-type intramembrane protease [Arthrobacter sp. NPDC090010]|uniref:PrsW family intramembrane metalloprotease n=1 Tax=Arthrobacter sp. NPDC090010 TaxID=3363942 RepID=UPI00381EDE89